MPGIPPELKIVESLVKTRDRLSAMIAELSGFQAKRPLLVHEERWLREAAKAHRLVVNRYLPTARSPELTTDVAADLAIEVAMLYSKLPLHDYWR